MIARCVVAVVFVFLWAGVTHAAESSAPDAPQDAILVLDASGSMWGQIDGVNKIVIAKDVVEGLVRALPKEQRLGLVAYGHRKKGDCNDIETLADVGADRAQLIDQIRSLSPVGKTPLSRSVEHAATELNYKKNAATVILVSDGLETCDVDPCALARSLEENGLDFTVHVIGFDVVERERKGLACIAQETGGTFLAADSADELTAALAEVATTQPAPPGDKVDSTARPQTVALKATLQRNGPDIQSRLKWVVTPSDSQEPVFTAEDAGYVDFPALPGDYTATAIWSGWPHEGQRVAGDKTGSKSFTVAAAPLVVSVPIDLEIPVALAVQAEVVEGNPVEVTWSGPDDLGAIISVNRLDDSPREYIYFTPAQRARDAFYQDIAQDAAAAASADTNADGKFDQDDQATTRIGGPSIEGDYEVRYVLEKPRLVLARQPLQVKDGGYALSAPAQVSAGTEFEVLWQGALTPGDFITLEKIETTSAYTPGGHARLKQGEPARLTAPAEPGAYEARYVLANGYTTYPGMQHAVQATAPVTVVAVEAAVSGPSTIVGGSTVSIEVTPVPGDAWGDDFVSLIKAGSNTHNRDSWQTLSRAGGDGTRVQLQAPNIDGDYEIAYFLEPGKKVLARQPVTVTRAQASLQGPTVIKVGQRFEITYTGPGYAGDRVVMVAADKSVNSMFNATLAYGFAVTATSGTGTVNGAKAAPQPGDYEVRYTTGLQHQVLARHKVKVVAD
ncbi:MAG: VWA domain-containing protein [Gammaproteobacteria bacterium]|nr:VWA domain-containing protein [Gammaproteobacteria bacterium]